MRKSVWMAEEDSSLIKQIKQGKKSPDLYVEGRTREAINDHRVVLRNKGLLKDCPPARVLKPWTMKDLDLLRRLTEEGLSPAKIVSKNLMPSHPRIFQISKAKERYYTKKQPGYVKKIINRLDIEDSMRLNEVLTGEGRFWSSRKLGKKFNLSESVINSRRRLLGVSLSWSEARSTEEYRKSKKRSEARLKMFTKKRWKKWVTELKSKFENLKEKIIWGDEAKSPARACLKCQEKLFALEDFFLC
ncbi:MAG: hypothetical protein AAB784_01010 [Patescibacteria group bacterium]